MPLEITFEHLDHSDALEARVRAAAAKLERFYGHITSARVAIARPQHRHHKTNGFQVRIHITVPGAADIAISRDPAGNGAHQDVHAAVRDAFDAARRQLQDLSRKRQDQLKTPAPTAVDEGAVAGP